MAMVKMLSRRQVVTIPRPSALPRDAAQAQPMVPDIHQMNPRSHMSGAGGEQEHPLQSDGPSHHS